jgi:hypothetical protein
VLRHEGKKGIKIISTEDGTKIKNIKGIHKARILNILISKDDRYIITAGKDN